MNNNAWDQYTPPAKKGMPLWGKLLLGCSLTVILGSLTCVGLVIWRGPKIMEDIGGAYLDKTWQHMEGAVTGLATDDGSRALYQKNPKLAAQYPTEEAFLLAAQGWRPKLGDFPRQRPDLMSLLKGGQSFSIQTVNDRQKVEYQIPNGGRLKLETERDELLNLSIE